MTWLLNIFGSIKNIAMALGAIFMGLYVAKQKYNAYKAEDKLKDIENKIAKTNVVIAKTKAKAKAQAVKAETETHIETLKELKKESKKVQKEMEVIEKDIQKKVDVKKSKKVTRNRKGKISIDV
jgi:uncharacterized membrane protein YciS (DUF1049 family)